MCGKCKEYVKTNSPNLIHTAKSHESQLSESSLTIGIGTLNKQASFSKALNIQKETETLGNPYGSVIK